MIMKEINQLIAWPELKNNSGMRVTLCTFGASIYEITLPNNQRVTLASQDKEVFLHSPFYYGKTIGRHSGRLVVPSYKIDEHVYPVKPYRSPLTSLHGGIDGISHRQFTLLKQSSQLVLMRYVSPDGEGGFPGQLTVDVSYQLTEDGKLIIIHQATTTAPTICNLTNHVYFHFARPHNHLNDVMLQMNSPSYLDIDSNFLIQGILPTKDTEFDFNLPTSLGQRLAMFTNHPFKGIDHYFFLNQGATPSILIKSTACPYRLEVTTTYPGVVMYTFNDQEDAPFIEGDNDYFHRGFTLECQNPPGGIHHTGMMDSILRPGKVYRHQTQYHFVKD
jgi:aldose 1-epimerase